MDCNFVHLCIDAIVSLIFIKDTIECVVKASNTNCVCPIHYCRKRFITNVEWNPDSSVFRRLRPYHAECTGSRPITEVKQRRAGSVLGWVTAWEHPVL